MNNPNLFHKINQIYGRTALRLIHWHEHYRIYSIEHNIRSLDKQRQQDTRADKDQHPMSLQHHQRQT